MDIARIDQSVSFILDLIDTVGPDTDAVALTEAAQEAAYERGYELTALEVFWVLRMVQMYLQGALDHQQAN